MEQRDDILDEVESEEEASPEYRQRSFRYLLYALGIGLLVFGRIWWLYSGDEVPWDETTIYGMLFLGVAGIWLFAGLGFVASIRAIKEKQIDVLQVGALVIHFALLIWSSIELWSMFLGRF